MINKRHTIYQPYIILTQDCINPFLLQLLYKLRYDNNFTI